MGGWPYTVGQMYTVWWFKLYISTKEPVQPCNLTSGLQLPFGSVPLTHDLPPTPL